MAIVTEDGTGLETANAYGTYAGFVTYHTDRGNTFTDDEATISAALIRASDFIDRMNVFKGRRLKVVQSMEFPRSGAVYRDGRSVLGVPPEIEQATYEYALRSMASALAPDPSYSSTGQTVASTSKRLGPMSKSETYANAGAPVIRRRYPLADQLLRELIVQGVWVNRA